MSTLILSVMGSDRPGLTQALAAAVLAAGGNWLESHLSRLGGLYVGSVLVEVPDAAAAAALEAAVRAVDAQGLQVRITPAQTGAAPAEPASATCPAAQFSLVGQDRPGIVHQVTALLSGLGVNIETFETHIAPEAHSGAPLFHMAARLRLPAGLAPQSVQSALEAISAEIMVDIAFTAPG